MKTILLALCLAVPALAQEPPSGPPPSGRGPSRMAYDTSKEVTLQGVVTAVHTRTQGPGTMVTLTLRDENGQPTGGPPSR